MDSKVEGYLVAAMALIPTGIGMVTAAQNLETRLMGLGLVGAGLVAVYLRGQQKDNSMAPGAKR